MTWGRGGVRASHGESRQSHGEVTASHGRARAGQGAVYILVVLVMVFGKYILVVKFVAGLCALDWFRRPFIR